MGKDVNYYDETGRLCSKFISCDDGMIVELEEMAKREGGRIEIL